MKSFFTVPEGAIKKDNLYQIAELRADPLYPITPEILKKFQEMDRLKILNKLKDWSECSEMDPHNLMYPLIQEIMNHGCIDIVEMLFYISHRGDFYRHQFSNFLLNPDFYNN